ncbi:MAG TPA: carbon monoxide dehydrogenase beta subunit family protein [Chthonomonadales bacterium]|nr:carbon monoxide dehydrogenase beta subunit family protein [Chthonomonadales bacterium]
MSDYRVLEGPECYLPPAAALHGVCLPEKGEAIVEGRSMERHAALRLIARKLANATTPTFFPGPLLLWKTTDYAIERGRLLRAIAAEVDGKVIPMPDYRPKYPMINPAVEINPNHPNLTIWHNKIDVGVFIGVHCHQANLALKIIRGGTNCYTIALCAEEGHEEANASLREADNDTLRQLLEEVKIAKKGGE